MREASSDSNIIPIIIITTFIYTAQELYMTGDHNNPLQNLIRANNKMDIQQLILYTKQIESKKDSY